MIQYTSVRFGVGIMCALLASAVSADEWAQLKLKNWHQWRGPLATGEAPHGDPPTTWDGEKNVKWKVAIPGHGTSTPIIWGDRIFILTAVETERRGEQAAPANNVQSRFRVASQRTGESPPAIDQPPERDPDQAARRQRRGQTEGADQREQRGDRGEDPAEQRPGRGRRGGRGFGFGFGGGGPPTNYYQFVILCLDKNSGATVWQRIACEAVPHEGKHQTGSFAAASPVTDGRHVYCSFGSRGIYCYDMDGKLKWQVDLGDMQTRNSFGEGASPALHGDTLIINWDHEGDSFIAALDATTGEEKWRQPRDEPTTWNTPLVVEHDGRTQVIVNGTNRARSYDFETGELIWECGGQTTNPIPSPMQLEDLAICMSGFRGYAAYAIPLDAKGDLTDTDKIAWQLDKGTPYVASAALIGDRLFFTKDRSSIMSSINARTGEVIIDQKRLPDLDDIYASPVGAAGRVYFSGRNGAVVVVDGTAEDLKILARNQLGETIDASPAIVGNELFIRGEKHLYCIAE